MILQPYGASSARIVIDPIAVEARLRELDAMLTESLLLEANLRGFEARQDATPAHAPTAAGTYHWHAFVPALRSELVQLGWSLKDHKNCPFVLSADKGIMLVVMTGDSDTGKTEGRPTNQADKGRVLSDAVQFNRNYELFESSAMSTLKQGELGTQLWVLLYHVERGPQGLPKEIRTELSLPSSFEGKKIVEWSERIILKTLDIENGPMIALPIPTAPIDIPVERRHTS